MGSVILKIIRIYMLGHSFSMYANFPKTNISYPRINILMFEILAFWKILRTYEIDDPW